METSRLSMSAQGMFPETGFLKAVPASFGGGVSWFK
jgi:hypothetical protein